MTYCFDVQRCALEAEHAQQLFVEHDDTCTKAWTSSDHPCAGSRKWQHAIQSTDAMPLIDTSRHAARPSVRAPMLEKYLQRHNGVVKVESAKALHFYEHTRKAQCSAAAWWSLARTRR